MIRIWLTLALTSCAVFETLEGRIDSPGTVYNCGEINGEPFEYCYYNDSAEELSDLSGLTCRPSSFFDRWPTLFGCWMHCDNPETEANEGAGKGCNAHGGGCFCYNSY